MQAVNSLVDLVGILTILLSVPTVLRLLYLLLRGRRDRARRVVTRLAVCVTSYVVVSLTASALRPERSIGLGERWCFDEWCVSVDRVTPHATADGITYSLDRDTYNAGRRPQRALYSWMFVRDASGRRYQSTTKDWAAAMAATVTPHESNRFAVDFVVPAPTRPVGFVTNHGSGNPCSLLPSLLFISQGGCLFHKYDSIRLQ